MCQSFYLGTRLGAVEIPDQITESYTTNNGEQNLGTLMVLFKPAVPLHLLQVLIYLGCKTETLNVNLLFLNKVN